MWNDPCRWVRARLPLLAGDDLLGADRRRARRHLIGCPPCRRHLEELKGSLVVLKAAASRAPARPDAPSLWPELARQIRESRHAVAPASWPRLGLWSGLALAAGLVVAVALIPRRAPERGPVVLTASKLPAPAPASSAPRLLASRPKLAAPKVKVAKVAPARPAEPKPATALAQQPGPAPKGTALASSEPPPAPAPRREEAADHSPPAPPAPEPTR